MTFQCQQYKSHCGLLHMCLCVAALANFRLIYYVCLIFVNPISRLKMCAVIHKIGCITSSLCVVSFITFQLLFDFCCTYVQNALVLISIVFTLLLLHQVNTFSQLLADVMKMYKYLRIRSTCWMSTAYVSNIIFIFFFSLPWYYIQVVTVNPL